MCVMCKQQLEQTNTRFLGVFFRYEVHDAATSRFASPLFNCSVRSTILRRYKA